VRRPRYPGEGEPGRRLFVAVPLPAEANDAIAALVERVRARGVPGGGRDVRWVRMEGLHITLRYLGPTLDPQVEPARAATIEAGDGATAFDLVLGKAGCFPPDGRPRALWVDILEGAPALITLAARLDASLVAAGWTPELRPLRAHLTLARSDGVPAGRAIAGYLMEEAAELRIGARVDRIGLFESLTGGGPARYEPVEIVPLA
jgi:RNA 2',3'-cyclic 3'-phosphodiesterase